MSSTVRVLLLAVLAAAFATACDDAPKAKPAAGGNTAAKPDKTGAQVPPNMVSAVSSSKTAGLIGVHFALEAPPEVGKPVGVNLAIIPHSKFAGLRVLFETSPDLILATGDRFEAPADTKAETVFTHKLVVQPKQEGVFLISAAVETESEEGTLTRLYSIPIIIYGPKPAPQAQVKPATTP
jgi:hypothetical protein